jgi:hypothetical protein
MVECFNSPAASFYGPEWQLVVDMFARYLAVINSSINFIIYFVAGKQFRNSSQDSNHPKCGWGKNDHVFYKLIHFFPIQDVTVITRAMACIPETLLGRRLSTVEEDNFDQELEKENKIKDLFDIGEISAKEISLTGNSDKVFEKVSDNTYIINGLSDVMRGVSDNNVEVIAPVVRNGVIETINVEETTSLSSKNKSCLLESHLWF